jgi:type II secretory ATPase GspE/PulE/Tfp pilus assembly ATPase PilB-like protein
LECAGGTLLLTVASARHLDFEDEQRLRFLAGMDVVCETLSPATVEKALHAAYRGSKGEYRSAYKTAHKACDEGHVEVSGAKTSTAPIPSLLDRMIERALLLNATDIHLESNPTGYSLRLRINGGLREEGDSKLPHSMGRALIRRLQILCDLPTCGRDAWQEGGFSFCNAGFSVRLRVSILSGVKGPSAVLRLLDNGFLEELCENRSDRDLLTALGLQPYEQKLIYAYLGRANGCILAVGPTGSGKSTLLYSLLNIVNDGSTKILTIEDPVERLVDGATQLEITQHGKEGFNELLKAGLRQDPDVVLVGEIRDAETARTALTAGITGHLVFSTLHCANSLEAISRLTGLGIKADLVTESLRLIICPRLLPLVCTNCKTRYLNKDRLEALLGIRTADIVFGKGCDACGHTGYSGSIAVFEMLAVTQVVKRALRSNASCNELAQAAREQYSSGKLVSLQDKTLALLEAGKIDPRTALTALGIAPQLLDFKY